MDPLLGILNGRRSEPLTLAETRGIVQDAATSKSQIERARKHLYVVQGLSRRIIDPNNLLSVAIAEVKSAADLIMVALALRYGANRNLYLQIQSIGPGHVMVYTVAILRASSRDTNLIMSVLLVLLIMGSQPSSPAFDQSGTRSVQLERKSEAEIMSVDQSFLSGVAQAISPRPTSTPERIAVGTSRSAPSGTIEIQTRGIDVPGSGVQGSSRVGTSASVKTSDILSFAPVPPRYEIQGPGRVGTSTSVGGQYLIEKTPETLVVSEEKLRRGGELFTIRDIPSREVIVPVGRQPPGSGFLIEEITPSRQQRPYQIMSVSEWLQSQGLPGLLDPQVILNSLPPKVKMVFGTITDRPDIAFIENVRVIPTATPLPVAGTTETTIRKIENGGYMVPNLEDVLVARSAEIIKRYPVNAGMQIVTQDRGEYIGIIQSVEAMSSEAFQHLIDNGLEATYFTINRLVIHLRSSFQKGDSILVGEIQTMLQYALSRGSTMDLEQLAMVSTTNDALAQSILATYRQPLWRKVCAGPMTGPLPDRIKALSFSLNIDQSASKKQTCDELVKLSEADAATLKNAAILRQQARVGSQVSSVSDFVSGAVPAVTCQNKTVLQHDPFEYNDAAMSFYKDDQGAVWCFTSNMYESLLNTPINPHTRKPLPPSFQAQLRAHLDILRRLGISPSNPIPVSTAIDNLTKNDDVSGEESGYIVDTILQSAKVAGIDPNRIRRLTGPQMNQILSTVKMEQPSIVAVDSDNRYFMTADHQLITFSRAAYHAIKEQPELAKLYFTNIKLQPI